MLAESFTRRLARCLKGRGRQEAAGHIILIQFRFVRYELI
jgi:hypothetical protein